MPSPKSSTRSPANAVAPQATPEDPVEARARLESPSLEVLEELEIANALSNLEMRMDSLEIDLARQSGTRDDDARRIAGEMAVMRARVEDALTAFSATAQELRELVRAAEKRIAEQTPTAVPETFQSQLAATMDGVMAGVGDVMEGFAADVRARVEQLGGQMDLVQESMSSVADTVGGFAPLAAKLAALEQTVARLAQNAPAAD